jgi:hypothetical protein
VQVTAHVRDGAGVGYWVEAVAWNNAGVATVLNTNARPTGAHDPVAYCTGADPYVYLRAVGTGSLTGGDWGGEYQVKPQVESWLFDTSQDGQSYSITLAAGTKCSVSWFGAAGTNEVVTGTGALQTVTHTFPGGTAEAVAWSFGDPETLAAIEVFSCIGCGLQGTIPNLTECTALTTFYCGHNTDLVGSTPYLSNCKALTGFDCGTNALDGTIGDMSGAVSLVGFACNDNALTGYDHVAPFPLALVFFNAQNNVLTETAVDDIIADFAVGIGSRPLAGEVWLDGTGNAAPSAGALILKSIIEAHGTWVVHVNTVM